MKSILKSRAAVGALLAAAMGSLALTGARADTTAAEPDVNTENGVHAVPSGHIEVVRLDGEQSGPRRTAHASAARRSGARLIRVSGPAHRPAAPAHHPAARSGPVALAPRERLTVQLPGTA